MYVEGTLVSSTYAREAGKGKNKTKVTLTSWQVKAQSIRKLTTTKGGKATPPPTEPEPTEIPF
ncbi:MAG: hypothetical protein WA765_18195 [Candidatus Acidiferrum sp.]